MLKTSLPMPKNSANPFQPARWLLAASAVAVLSACASYSGIAPTAKPLDTSALGLTDAAATAADPTQTPAPAVDTDWWKALNDTQLTALIARATANSPSLRATQARLALAQAQTDQRKAIDGPQLGAELDLTREQFSANTIYPPPYGGNDFNQGTLQANASWELDFFGKNSAALAAAVGQTRAVEADLQAARGLLASRIARNYYQLVRIDAQLQLLQRTLALREQIKSLVAERLHAGLDTQLELEQSRSALPDVQLQIEQLNEQKALTRNALAALTAQPVSALELQVPSLSSIIIAAQPQVLPLNLLGTRADITAARWRIEAAQQDVASAKAQFYPNINLMAYVGYSAIGFDKTLQSDSQQWGVGPAITLPLFEGGRLRAQLSGKTADLDGAIESYNAQVFEAVHEVSDQLASIQAVQRQQSQQAEALASAQHSHLIAQQRYQAGLATQLNVLLAELPVLTQERNGADLMARALDTRVQLLHAIGTATP